MDNPVNQTPKFGVIYIATGRKYIEMAMKSALSIRKFSPELNIHLFGDWDKQGFNFEKSCAPFTSVGMVEDAHYRSKVDYMCKSLYDRTLYLDTDTRVAEDITPMFKLLDRFDIALAHAPERVTRLQKWNTDVPDSFPQFNSGVILYKNSKEVIQVLSDWKQAFQEAKFRSDQVTLRELLWKSDLRIATLPPEYNLRFFKYIFLWNRREAKAKILHLHYYRRGLFFFAFPWIVTFKKFSNKITGKKTSFR